VNAACLNWPSPDKSRYRNVGFAGFPVDGKTVYQELYSARIGSPLVASDVREQSMETTSVPILR
jgi:hypothetical protein